MELDIAVNEAVWPLKMQSGHYLMLIRVNMNAQDYLYHATESLSFILVYPLKLSMLHADPKIRLQKNIVQSQTSPLTTH